MLMDIRTNIGYDFEDPSLFDRILFSDNENVTRLAFLGNGILEFAISEILFTSHEYWNDETIEAMKNHLTNPSYVAMCAKKIGLDGFLRGDDEEESALDTLFKAILAAVYLDGGNSGVRKVVDILYGKRAVLLAELQVKLGYTFRDLNLLELALTHSSKANEEGGEHNERLEFLGDAVLETCISEILFHKHTEWREGSLTKTRSQLVCTESLAQLSRRTAIQEALLLGRGEEKQGGRDRDSILSDTFEAVLAAIYLDGGFPSAQKTVRKVFDGFCDDANPTRIKDAKTLLQEIARHKFKAVPIYRLLDATGPDHNKTFLVELEVANLGKFMASSSRCKSAEQKAAQKALDACALLEDKD